MELRKEITAERVILPTVKLVEATVFREPDVNSG